MSFTFQNAALASQRVISDLFLLLQLQTQLSWNRFWRMKLWRKLLNVAVIAFMGVSLGGMSLLAGIACGSLLKRYPELMLESLLPGLILTAIALMLLISSFGIALGSLFFSRDLDLLMSAPVSRRAVFISKLMGGFSLYYGLMLIITVPALVAYGVQLRYGPLYYVLMLVSVLGTPLLPAGLGALCVMLVARVAPARRVREVLGLVAALFGTSCALLGNTTQYWSRQFSTAISTSLASVLAWIQSIANLPVPSLLAGRGLVEAGQGNLFPALGFLSSFLLITFGFFGACVWLAERMYASGWLRMQSAGEARRKGVPKKPAGPQIFGAAPQANPAGLARSRDLLAGAQPFFAIALKDWRVIPRDLRNFAQFLSPLFLIPLIYIQLFSTPGGRSGRNLADVVNQLGGAGNFDPSSALLAGTVLMSTIFVFSRIAQTGISMEGRSYWVLKAAPISGRDLLLGKFIAAFVPFGILSTILMIVAALVRGFSLGGSLYGWFGIQLLGAGMLAMDVGLAVPWANLAWDDPRKMHSGWGGLVALIGYVVIGLLSGACLALPFLAERFLPFLAAVAWLVGPFLAVGITCLVAGLAVWLGLSRLKSVGDH